MIQSGDGDGLRRVWRGMGQEGVMGQVSARVHAGGRNLEQRYARVDGAGKETRGNSRVETVRDGTVARYEQEGVREKEMKGESTDDSMVKAAVERGEQELYASKQYARKVRKASRQVASMTPRLKLHLQEASRWNKALGKSDLDAQ
jgi:hypothetical protein